MDPCLADLYVKKQVRVRWGQRQVALDIPMDVFSSFQVDRGTQLLLREIGKAEPRWGRALDLGCGYGPIALCLAATGMADEVHAIDRDALAVAFTARNAERNGLANILARGGLAYDGLPAPSYDAIVTNLPAKAGEPVHRLMLLGAAEHLTAGGEVWAVVVAPLEEQTDAILADPAVDLIGKEARKEHAVYRYAFAGRPDVPADPYRRGECSFQWGTHRYPLSVVYGLPEFDTLSYATEAVLREASARLKAGTPNAIAAWEPGQGHIPVILARLCPAIERLDLVSRDLLALRASEGNLSRAGFAGEVRSHHTIGVTAPESPGLIVGVASEGEGIDIQAGKVAIARDRYPDVPALLGARSSFAARLARALNRHGVRAKTGRKRRGACCISCG